MASLKEVRGRITSVTSTKKITSAMKMVSAAKLRRAQDAITNYLPYQEKLSKTLEDFITYSTDELTIPLADERPVKKVAIIAISSNSSLCGAFNSNVIKKTDEVIRSYENLSQNDFIFYTIGKKISESLIKRGVSIKGRYDNLVDKTDYDQTAAVIDDVIELFLAKEIDAVQIVYNHFKNAAVQQIAREVVLPLTKSVSEKTEKRTLDYILEPDKDHLILMLVPTVLRLRLYSAILDSIASEHGARMTAMQTATDNAEELIQDLKLKYNKARQEAITKEILDIVGGAEALRS
jgi:F-type H+-transporting ATPase subunit gamma